MSEKTHGSGFSYQIKAVIDVGSTSIRMAVAQICENGSFSQLDSLSQSVSIGSDTFNFGEISRSTVENCVGVLRNFKQVLAEYRIDITKDMRAVATSAVSEAANRAEFLDRVYMATGINVEIIDGTEVNRLTFLALAPLLRDNPELGVGRLLAAEAGGGSTELLGIENGRVFFAHSYKIGSYRLREIMNSLHASETLQIETLETEIASGMRLLNTTARGSRGNVRLLLMGGDIRFAAHHLLSEWNESGFVSLKAGKLEKFAEKVIHRDVERVAADYGLAIEKAQTLGPALKIYARMINKLGLKEVLVCGVTLRDGLMAEAAAGNAWTRDFVKQILHSAEETGRRYFYDREHADCVTENSLILFDSLQREHSLDYRYRVILTVAAKLHDIGVFISSRNHHKHSMYLIQNSEIFGLSDLDIKLAALVARYHRRAVPRESHIDYMSLTREHRMVVSKLSAILRVADSLDRSHMQTISSPVIIPENDVVYIKAGRPGNFTSEKRILERKGDLFEKIYGRPVVLLNGNG